MNDTIQAGAGSREEHPESWFSAYFGKAYKGFRGLFNGNGGSRSTPMGNTPLNGESRKIYDILTFEQDLGIIGFDSESKRKRIAEISAERPGIAEEYIKLRKAAGYSVAKEFPLSIPSNGGNGHAPEVLPRALSEYAALGKELYSDSEPLLLENKIVKTRSRKKRTEPRKERYAISDSAWESLNKYKESDIAAELIKTVKGVGVKRAAKMLRERGREVDESVLMKLYRKGGKKAAKYGIDDFCSEDGLKAFESKYSRSDMLIPEGGDNSYVSGPEPRALEGPAEEEIIELTENDVYEDPMEEKILELTEVYEEPEAPQAAYHGISKELKNALRTQSVKSIAKGLMSVREIEYKDIPKELREFYKELGMEIDIPDSRIHEWYREARREHKEGKWPIYNTLDDWARDFAVTDEVQDSPMSGRKKAIGGTVAGLAAAAATLLFYTGTLAPDYSRIQKAEAVEIVQQQKADYFQQAPEKAIYTVKKGNCLWTIAARECDLEYETDIANKAVEIKNKNKAKYPSLEKNWHHIEPGWNLEL